jgi:hypothetical protein
MATEQTPMEKFISENWLPDGFAHSLISAYYAEKEYVNRHVGEYLKQIDELKAQVVRLQGEVGDCRCLLIAKQEKIAALQAELLRYQEMAQKEQGPGGILDYWIAKADELQKQVDALTAEKGVIYAR